MQDDKIILSKKSQNLINNYVRLYPFQYHELIFVNSRINITAVLAWLNKEEISLPTKSIHSNLEKEHIIASLQTQLLIDLLAYMDFKKLLTDKKKKKSTSATLKFIFLALAGILFVGCGGFDSIASMLFVLAVPNFVVLIIGICFALVSILVFCSYELVQISKNLQIEVVDSPQLLDTYLLQINTIKSIRKIANTYDLAQFSLEELNRLHAIIGVLQKSMNSLNLVSAQFANALQSNSLYAVKIIVSGLAGLLAFGSGFFAGQSVGWYIASLFIPAVLPTFWPVIVFSLIIGTAAFCLYWHVELESVKKLVSGWFGLDEEKIAVLCEENKLVQETKKLEHIKGKIHSMAAMIECLTQDNKISPPVLCTPPVKTNINTLNNSTISANLHSFYSQPISKKATNPLAFSPLRCK